MPPAPSTKSPRWSDWHWIAGGRLVRVNLDNIQEEEECGDRAVLEQDLQTLRDIRQEYLDLALKAKSKSRESELMRGVKGKDRQIAWVEGKLRELGSDCDQSGDKDGDLVNPDTIKSPTKNDTSSNPSKSPTNFRRKNTPPSESNKSPTKGRGKNKLPASGHISPTVQRKDGKEYPASREKGFPVTWPGTIQSSLSGSITGASRMGMAVGRTALSGFRWGRSTQ